MTKWMRNLRALPSEPAANDYLKTEYIDNNLNTSRKLISNVSRLAEETRQMGGCTEEMLELLLRLRNARSELAFLDSVLD